MPALPILEPGSPSADPMVARLDEVLAQLAVTVADCTQVADADRIDRIARLEKVPHPDHQSRPQMVALTLYRPLTVGLARQTHQTP